MNENLKKAIDSLAENLYDIFIKDIVKKTSIPDELIPSEDDVVKTVTDFINNYKKRKEEKKKKEEENINKLSENDKEKVKTEENPKIKEAEDEHAAAREKMKGIMMKGNERVADVKKDTEENLKKSMSDKKNEIKKDLNQVEIDLTDLIEQTGELGSTILQIPNAAISTGPTGVSTSPGSVVINLKNLNETARNICTKIDKIQETIDKYEPFIEKLDEEDEDAKIVKEAVTESLKIIQSVIASITILVAITGQVPSSCKDSKVIEDAKKAKEELTPENMTPPSQKSCLNCKNIKVDDESKQYMSFTKQLIWDNYVNIGGVLPETDPNYGVYQELVKVKNGNCPYNSCEFCKFARDVRNNEKIKEQIIQYPEENQLGSFCKNNTN